MAARGRPRLYAPQEGDVVIPGAEAIHQFFGFTADCGQAAAEVVYSWAKGQPPSGEHINRVVSAMQQRGLAGPGGLSTLEGNSKALAAQGIPNRVTGDWRSALNQYAGLRPIQLGVANAGVLPGDELGLQRHFLTVVGRTQGGNLVVSDPDNAAAKQGLLNEYTPAQIASANPWGAIVPDDISPIISGSPFSGVYSGAQYAQSPAGQQVVQAGGNLITVNMPSILDTLLSQLPGVKGSSDFLWRFGLITLGVTLIIVGVLVTIWPTAKATGQAATQATLAAAKVAA